MATATVQIDLPGLTGFSLTLDLYPRGSDTAAVSGMVLTEATNRKGTYIGTTTAGLDGIYFAVAKEGSTVRGSGYVLMTDTASVHIIEEIMSLILASGTGARARTVVVVTDGTDPIEGALVRFSKGGETFVQLTDINGEKSFSLDDGTWTVSITASGFSFTPTTLVVTGNGTTTYVMTPVVTPTPSPGEGQVTGVGNVYDEYGELDSSKTVYAQMILAARATGFFDGKVAEYTPIVGIVTIPKLFKTATYQFWIGNSSKRLKFYVPETDEDSIDLPPILGDECDDCTA